MLRIAVRALVIGLVATIAFGLPSAHAAAKQDEPPTGDCVTMVSLVLGGLAVRSGAAAYAVGRGAVYANASSLIGNITGVASTYNCVTYLVPRYIDMVCEQSRQSLRYRKTWEARALVTLATRGRHTRC